MNLSTKVLATLALALAVALTTAAVLIGRSVNSSYRTYVTDFRRGQLQQVAAQAGQLRAAGISWDETQAWLDSGLAWPGAGGHGRGMRRQQAGGQGDAPTFLIVDPTTGAPLAAEASRRAPPSPAALANAVSIVVDDEVVAAVAATAPLDAIGQAEQAVLDQVNRAIGISALLSGAVALLLGALLVTSILHPLRRLEAAVKRVTEGDLSAHVTTTSRDEIGRLTTRFNAMTDTLAAQEALRRRMVADIAHELRTPLSVIQGNLQAILDGVYPLEEREIRTVYDETRLLSRLVTDLHELAQAEAGHLPLAMEPLDVRTVLLEMAAGFRALADRQQITLSVMPPEQPLCVAADANRLQQILHNLLGNALRHTPTGGQIRLGAAPMAGGLTRFWVENEGPGIASRDLPYIYERFYRAEPAPTAGDPPMASATMNHAGLGLAIVKALTEAHGGAVGVESTPGRSATFWFELRSCL